MSFMVLDAGALTTVQDLGREGLAYLGVPRSGAADRASHARANALVGNAPAHATLETTMLGCRLRFRTEAVVAVAGARCEVLVGGVRAPFGAPFRVAPGQRVTVGPAETGVRSYVAVRGGVDAPRVLGSRATDTLSGLGPAPLHAGDILEVGPAGVPSADLFGVRAAAPAMPTPPAAELALAMMPGPRADWIAVWAELGRAQWTVSDASNRVGVRLEGAPLRRSREDELPSEGIVLGSVQLPPSGLPVIFLADHPVTGGYPVIGVLTGAATALAAQARPGARVRLVAVRGRSA